jgi:hypothetical protein
MIFVQDREVTVQTPRVPPVTDCTRAVNCVSECAGRTRTSTDSSRDRLNNINITLDRAQHQDHGEKKD